MSSFNKKVLPLPTFPTTALSYETLTHLIHGIADLEKQLAPIHSLQTWEMSAAELVRRIFSLRLKNVQGNKDSQERFWAMYKARDAIALLGKPDSECRNDVVAKLGAVMVRLKENAEHQRGDDGDAEVEKGRCFTKFPELLLELRRLIVSFCTFQSSKMRNDKYACIDRRLLLIC